MSNRLIFAAMIAALTISSAARCQELPHFDIEKGCAANPRNSGVCAAEERRNYSMLQVVWNRASSGAKTDCSQLEGQLTGDNLGLAYTTIAECLIPLIRVEQSQKAVAVAQQQEAVKQARQAPPKPLKSASR